MTEKPMRADAKRNRERIVSAATDAFAEHGADASLEDIARHAGVGIGTLYRHFPTREALYIAVHRAEIARVAERADELLATHHPQDALNLWIDEFVDFLQAKQGGMASVFRTVMEDGENPFIDLRALTRTAAARLITAAAGDHEGAGAIDPNDILVALHGISLATSDPDQTHRLVSLLLAGIRSTATPMTTSSDSA